MEYLVHTPVLHHTHEKECSVAYIHDIDCHLRRQSILQFSLVWAKDLDAISSCRSCLDITKNPKIVPGLVAPSCFHPQNGHYSPFTSNSWGRESYSFVWLKYSAFSLISCPRLNLLGSISLVSHTAPPFCHLKWHLFLCSTYLLDTLRLSIPSLQLFKLRDTMS